MLRRGPSLSLWERATQSSAYSRKQPSARPSFTTAPRPPAPQSARERPDAVSRQRTRCRRHGPRGRPRDSPGRFSPVPEAVQVVDQLLGHLHGRAAPPDAALEEARPIGRVGVFHHIEAALREQREQAPEAGPLVPGDVRAVVDNNIDAAHLQTTPLRRKAGSACDPILTWFGASTRSAQAGSISIPKMTASAPRWSRQISSEPPCETPISSSLTGLLRATGQVLPVIGLRDSRSISASRASPVRQENAPEVGAR